ncbi:MAG: hypothetical protein EBR02_05410 [Alphaproteobacteria bacterium]|nr:hypothetical protein [Alphaproteobacteria bacterium]
MHNNARGNNTQVAISPPETPDTAAPSQNFASYFSNNSADGIATAQTNFFAQLIGQGGGQDARALLVVYEKLVQLSEVRYKPSDAGVPEPEPAGVFGKLVQQEKAVAREPQRTLPQAPSQPASDAPALTASTLALPVIKLTRDTRSGSIVISVADDVSEATYNNDYAAVLPQQPAKLPEASGAYVAAIARNLSDVGHQTIEEA